MEVQQPRPDTVEGGAEADVCLLEEEAVSCVGRDPGVLHRTVAHRVLVDVEAGEAEVADDRTALVRRNHPGHPAGLLQGVLGLVASRLEAVYRHSSTNRHLEEVLSLSILRLDPFLRCHQQGLEVRLLSGLVRFGDLARGSPEK